MTTDGEIPLGGWCADNAEEEHPCDRCGKPGSVQLDPYQSEVDETDEWVCLCDKCYTEVSEMI